MSNWLTVTSNWHSNSYSNINGSNWHYKNNDAFVLYKIKGTNSNDLTTHSLAANMTATWAVTPVQLCTLLQKYNTTQHNFHKITLYPAGTVSVTLSEMNFKRTGPLE